MKSRYRCLYSKYEPVAAQDWRQLVWLCPMVTKPPLLQEIRLLQESYLVKQREALSLILTSRRRGHGSAWGLWLRRSSPCCWWSYSEVCQKKGQMNQSVTTYNLKMQSRLSNRRWWTLWNAIIHHLLSRGYWLKREQSVVDGQSLCQSDRSFVPKLVTAKTADKNKNRLDTLRKKLNH